MKRWAVRLLMAWLTGSAHAAIDCWVPAKFQASTGYGDSLSAPRHAPLRERLMRAKALLEGDRQLAALPGVRLQAKGFLGAPSSGIPLSPGELRVGLHRPAVWSAPGCGLKQAQADYVVPIELGVRFNDPGPLWQLLASPTEAVRSGFFPLPEVTGEVGGEPVYGGRAILLAPPGLKALVPHTVADHLQFWDTELQALGDEAGLAALRRHRKSLSPAQLTQPVALGAPTTLSEPLWHYQPVGAPGTAAMFRLNPQLWRGQAAHQLRLLTLHVWVNNEGDALTGPALAWLQGLDLQAWRALLQS